VRFDDVPGGAGCRGTYSGSDLPDGVPLRPQTIEPHPTLRSCLPACPCTSLGDSESNPQVRPDGCPRLPRLASARPNPNLCSIPTPHTPPVVVSVLALNVVPQPLSLYATLPRWPVQPVKSSRCSRGSTFQ